MLIGRNAYFSTNDRKGGFGDATKILAKHFAHVHSRYITYSSSDNDTAGDLGWFYNERANISFLAAAAWRERDWVAIEEYAVEKTHGREKRKGRADLYIGASLGKSKVSCGIAIEAKQAWPRWPTSLRATLDISNDKSALSRACGAARESLSRRYADYRCGAVFVTPQIYSRNEQRAAQRRDEMAECFWDACEALSKRTTWAAFSFVSPHLEQDWPSKDRKHRFSYPAVGVVLVVI